MSVMEKIFVTAVNRFIARETKDRNIQAFKCFLMSIVMVQREVFLIAFDVITGFGRLISILIATTISGGYILVVHPVLFLVRRCKT